MSEDISWQQLETLIKENRSCRRFVQEENMKREELEDLVELARNTASASNRQPLKYYLSHRPEENEKIFPTLSWAGALRNWDGPEEGERPGGYIIVLGDRSISENYYSDPGIVLQTMMLGARVKGRASCIFAAIDRESLRDSLNLAERFKILNVLALGTPAEKAEEIFLEELEDDDYDYWRDEKGLHHVPKRDLEEIIIN